MRVIQQIIYLNKLNVNKSAYRKQKYKLTGLSPTSDYTAIPYFRHSGFTPLDCAMSERVDVSAVRSGRRLHNQIIFNPIKMSRSLEKSVLSVAVFHLDVGMIGRRRMRI